MFGRRGLDGPPRRSVRAASASQARRSGLATRSVALASMLVLAAGAVAPAAGQAQGGGNGPGQGQGSGPPSSDDGSTGSGQERSPMRESLERKVDELPGAQTMRLQLHAEPGQLDAAVAAVERAGGDVHTAYDTLIIADLAVNRIPGVANSAPVRLAGEYVEPELHEQGEPIVRERDLPDGVTAPERDGQVAPLQNEELVVSEGVEISRADALHALDITGEDVTIAILDAQFDVNNEQYADQVVATLGLEEGDPGFQDVYEFPGGHGDNVADIVAAMAPDADLILADTFFIEGFDLFDALAELENDWPEVDVANYSVGHLVDFRLDGLDPISLRIADFTEETESIFVNSAGNSAAIEDAWIYIPGVGPFPLPQQRGDVFTTGGPAQFTDRGQQLLDFGQGTTRLPLTTFEDVATDTGPIGWTIVHWDADPVVDDQKYMARLYPDPDTNQALAVSRTTNPWETIEVLGEYFMGEVGLTLDVEDDAWVATDVSASSDIEDDIVTPGEDEQITSLLLPEGQRYEIRNEAWRDHPFELRDGDDVLLSQDPDVEGEFEDDTDVDWQVRNRRVEFTLTVELAEAVTDFGSAADEGPTGAVFASLPPPIYLEVQRVRADEEHTIDVWASFGGVNIPTPWATDERSVGIPAVSQDDDLLSIGAVQAVDLGLDEGETALAFNQNAGDLKAYSSQGPTQDGRRGIDLAAPSHVSTNAIGPVEVAFGFNGTSAAAPHVTGAVGLLAGIEPNREEIRQALFAAGRGIDDPEVDDPGEDNTQIGFGYLDVFGAHEQLNGTED